MNEILLTNFHFAAFDPFFSLIQMIRGLKGNSALVTLRLIDCVTKFLHLKSKKKKKIGADSPVKISILLIHLFLVLKSKFDLGLLILMYFEQFL